MFTKKLAARLIRETKSQTSRRFLTNFSEENVNQGRLAFIGSGTMTRAFIGSLLKIGYPKDKIGASDFDFKKLQKLTEDFDVYGIRTNQFAAKKADCLFLAVKPNIVENVLEELRPVLDNLDDQPLIISIASGVTISNINSLIGNDKPVIRAMTNTSTQVGKGCSVLCENDFVTFQQRQLAEYIFASAGTVSWVKEGDLDAYTAFIGVGPAYYFLLTEALENAAQSLGIPQEDACKMSAQLLSGSAELLKSGDKSAKQLRAQVTTPGGVTNAVMESLAHSRFNNLLFEAMQTGVKQSINLGIKPRNN